MKSIIIVGAGMAAYALSPGFFSPVRLAAGPGARRKRTAMLAIPERADVQMLQEDGTQTRGIDHAGPVRDAFERLFTALEEHPGCIDTRALDELGRSKAEIASTYACEVPQTRCCNLARCATPCRAARHTALRRVVGVAGI